MIRPGLSALAEAVRAGLTSSPKTLPAALLYDDLGSALFEAITYLPEYELTRADLRLIAAHAAELGARLGACDVIELGPGGGRKAAHFLQRFAPGQPLRFSAIDVSAAALRECVRIVRVQEAVEVEAIEGTYIEGLREAIARRRGGRAVLVLFLGSNLSNFERDRAQAFLRSIRETMAPGDALLLATDLDKAPEQLLPAYDDALGITAAFNKNLLLRLNHEFGAHFDLAEFRHEARWDAAARRIEMHLVALRTMTISLPQLDLTIDLVAGDSIWTESSHRFRLEELRQWGDENGWETMNQWVDSRWAFAHTLYRVR